MELLLVVVVLGGLVFLALFLGYDSRPSLRSREEQQAEYGMSWDLHRARLEDLRREAEVWRQLK